MLREPGLRSDLFRRRYLIVQGFTRRCNTEWFEQAQPVTHSVQYLDARCTHRPLRGDLGGKSSFLRTVTKAERPIEAGAAQALRPALRSSEGE